MKKVCIIETESHYEVVRNFALSIQRQVELTIITNSYCAGNLGLLDNTKTRIINYEMNSKDSEKCALLTYDYKLTTTPPEFDFFQSHRQWFIGSDLVIHNMNYWLEPFAHIHFIKRPSANVMKSFLRFWKYLPDGNKKRRIYKKAFKNYIAPSEQTYRKYNPKADKLKDYLRLDYQFSTPTTVAQSFIQVVIPGSVNAFRDYGPILKLLSQIAQNLSVNLKVVMLGKDMRNSDFTPFRTDKLEIVTFNNHLSDEAYMKYLKSADFGILPLNHEVDFRGILELKGTSNISGGINDFYGVGVKGFVPAFYEGKKEGVVESYENLEDLKSKIEVEVQVKGQNPQPEIDDAKNAQISEHNLKLIGGND